MTKEQDWAKPYIAWLYDKGITNGIGDNKFGNGPCTAQMYAAFMLRALGYKDTAPNGGKTDFAFDDAVSFAQKKKSATMKNNANQKLAHLRKDISTE